MDPDYGRYQKNYVLLSGNEENEPKVWTVDGNRRPLQTIPPREENMSIFSNTPRQQLEKYLAGSFMIIAILCLALLLSVFAGRRNDVLGEMCQTPQCIQSALVLLTSMNNTVDPCEDFYQFACGDYKADFSDEAETGVVENWVTEQQKKQKKLFLEKLREDNAPNDPSGVRAARRVFKACQNIPAINAVGLTTLWATLEKLGLPRHPLNTTGKELPWIRALGRTLRYLALDPIISFTVKPSDFNSSINLVTFITPDDSGDIGIFGGWSTLKFFNHKVTSSVKSVKKWNTYVGKIIIYLIEADGGKIKDDDQLNTFTASILKVFGVIVKALESDKYPLDGAKTDCSTVQININEFQTILDNSTLTGTSKLQIKPFLEEILTHFPDVNYDYSRELLIVLRLKYYRVLSALMEQLTDEDLVLFIWWQVVSLLAIHTNEDLMYLNDQLLRNSGDQYTWSRETVCYFNVFYLMKPSLVYFMLREVDEAKIEKVEDMATNIQKSLVTTIITQGWMDEKTKRASVNRMKSVQFHIGVPESIKNLSFFDELYRSRGENRPGVNEGQIPLYEFKHLENLQNLVDFEVKKMIKRLRTATTLDQDFDPLLINAYHQREFNSVTIPLAILNLPIYGWGNECERSEHPEVLIYAEILIYAFRVGLTAECRLNMRRRQSSLQLLSRALEIVL